MESITELGNIITDKLKNGSKLQDLRSFLTFTHFNVDNLKILFNELNCVKTNVYSNEYIDIFIICWNNNQYSKIHDHAEKGCLMKVLKGELQEDLYCFGPASTSPLQGKRPITQPAYIRSMILQDNDVSYREGNEYLHNIVNKNCKTISLHIYSPPGYKTNYYDLKDV